MLHVGAGLTAEEPGIKGFEINSSHTVVTLAYLAAYVILCSNY
jgi:hypothetical protein